MTRQPDLRAQLRNLFNHAEAGHASLLALKNLGLVDDPDVRRLADLLERFTAGHAGRVSCHRIHVNGFPVTDWIDGDVDPETLEATHGHCFVERAYACPETLSNEDTLPVPIEVLRTAANLDLMDHDNRHGADYTTCPSCSARESGQHVQGKYQQPRLAHDSSCMRQRAQEILNYHGVTP